jgi:hypothetical protein
MRLPLPSLLIIEVFSSLYEERVSNPPQYPLPLLHREKKGMRKEEGTWWGDVSIF